MKRISKWWLLGILLVFSIAWALFYLYVIIPNAPREEENTLGLVFIGNIVASFAKIV
ncbi:hypothetical protein [Lysinibacillus endophyticus]|uniref:hypothetical protein n=1 Tax=Ureibacillus endophyticus TaxID=1978490 RepID=UPI00147491C9|nr:hypothetical protein [Lysinibacillus endophyticus]MCP1144230.1 hypothetical protein [Lysinibacillus endophyticus]